MDEVHDALRVGLIVRRHGTLKISSRRQMKNSRRPEFIDLVIKRGF
jgi:hypothetical protein